MLPQENESRCSIFPACRASSGIKPEHVTPAIEQLLADGRATTAAALKRDNRPGTNSSRRSRTRTSASAAPGARSRTCTR